MRNLELLRTVPVSLTEALADVQCMTINSETGTVYVATGTELVAFQPPCKEVLCTVSLSEHGYLPADGSGVITGIQHLPDQEAVCVATAAGHLILWSDLDKQLDYVGNCESGLTCMSWSPDQELVMFTTGENTLLTMTRDFDPVSEVPIFSADFGSEQPITVGWGKKETQFHGKEGKPSLQKKMPVENAPVCYQWDDGKPRISWRGDGQYFAVSSISPETGARQIRVWSREGILECTSEDVPGLEQAFFWKPSGSLMASSQRKPNKHDIVFFEKNGLRHGEFTLPFSQLQVKVVELMWNIDSTLLAVWLEDLPGKDDAPDHFVPKSYAQVWSVGNYHWYLKQHLEFPAHSADRLASLAWDPEKPLKLHIICQGGTYACYEWCWSVMHSQGHCHSNHSTVAVIDGGRLLLTPIRHMVVPPPMSAVHMDFDSPVNQVVFGPMENCNDAAVFLADGRLVLLKDLNDENSFKPPGKIPEMSETKRLSFGAVGGWDGPCQIHQLVWYKSRSFLALVWDMVRQVDVLCELELKTEDELAHLRFQIPLEEPALKIHHNTDSGSVAVQLVDGSILKYSSGASGPTLSPWMTSLGQCVQLPQPCPHMATVVVGTEELVLGLTEHGRLYANDQQISSNCTSFAVHDEFLLLTTFSHTLRCISLLEGTSGLPALLEDKPHPLDESIRRLERGSKIVIAITQDTKVVLQMPRGNLETIHPRALMISAIQKCLDSCRYKEAFVLMRKHRINMNLIYDHNPQMFLQNVEEFVRQVEKASHINLFLSDLKEEDVTVTMYSPSYPGSATTRSRQEQLSGRTKVDTACDAVREAVEKINYSKYVLCILTAYIKKTVPELENVLRIIKDLKGPQDGAEGVSKDDALKYVLLLVDVNELYKVALGMYDFQLVLTVAEKSQMDPKEFLPFLNQLKQMETNYQRYSIDKHLKRFKSAVDHLSKCGNEYFEECLQLVKDQNLFVHAMKLYQEGSEENKAISCAYGQKLVHDKKYEEAGIVFARCESFEEALEAFQHVGNWQQAFCMATRLNYSSEQISSLARTLAEYLKSHTRFLDAARVLEEYAKDHEEATEMLIEGHIWEEALRIMYKYDRTDIIETHFKPGLLEAWAAQRHTIESQIEQFDRQKNRLKVVRETKEKLRLEMLEGGGFEDDRDNDMFSDTSSISGVSATSQSSRGSRSTGRSSKNRRKAEKKKYSLREGSANEDIALMKALSELVTAVDKSKDDTKALLRMLVLFGYDEQASVLQAEFESIVSQIESSGSEIWQPVPSTDMGTGLAIGPESTANSIAAAATAGRMNPTNTTDHYEIAELTRPPSIRKHFKWKLDQLSS